MFRNGHMKMAKDNNSNLFQIIVILPIFCLNHAITSAALVRDRRSTDDIVLTLSVDNSIEIYVDGSTIATHSGWHAPITVTLPSNPGILAFRAHNSGGPAAVLASLSNGLVTEAYQWRCTDSTPGGNLDWKAGGYDDSSWAIATEYGTNGQSPWGLIPGVAAGAKYIWTSNNNVVGYIYCRIRIGVEILATCDNEIWVFADGTQYTTTGSTASLAWTVSDYYILPRGTEVFGIKCTNYGGPSGILASVYNGPVTDIYNWKCTHDPTDGWSTLGYDDSSWDIPQKVGDHGSSPWGNLQNPYPISFDADWIWTQTRYDDVSSNHHTTYCRVSIETPVTCWTHYTNKNSVWGLISGGARTDNRPNTFYFGDYGDDVTGCAAACARESNCAAYTLHLTSFPSSNWRGLCYGRSDYRDQLVTETEL